MSLLELPTELVLSIAGLLKRERDINALVQTNRRLYSVLNLTLYRYSIWRGNNSGLCWAALNGFSDKVQLLLDMGANVRATPRNSTHATALHLASAEGHLGIVETLIKNGADIDAQTSTGSTPLHEAVSSGFECVTQMLLDKGADFMKTRLDGSRPTVLHLASSFGFTHIVELLLKKGMGIEVKDGYMQTPLHCAVQVDEENMVWRGNIETVEFLLDHNAKKNAWDIFDRRPKDLAKGHPNKVVELLLQSSTDITVSQAVLLDQRRRAKSEQEEAKILKRQEMIGKRTKRLKISLRMEVDEFGEESARGEPEEGGGQDTETLASMLKQEKHDAIRQGLTKTKEQADQEQKRLGAEKTQVKEDLLTKQTRSTPRQWQENEEDISLPQTWPLLQGQADQKILRREANRYPLAIKQQQTSHSWSNLRVAAENQDIIQQAITIVSATKSLQSPSRCPHPPLGWLKVKGKKVQAKCQMCCGVCAKFSYRCGDCSVIACASCRTQAVGSHA